MDQGQAKPSLVEAEHLRTFTIFRRMQNDCALIADNSCLKFGGSLADIVRSTNLLTYLVQRQL